jgi:hypothetical protein
MSRTASKTVTAAASAAAAMTTPAQLERLGEHLRKLRLLKSGERLEAMLQHAVTMNIRGNSYRLKDKLKAGLVRPQDDSSTNPGGEI